MTKYNVKGVGEDQKSHGWGISECGLTTTKDSFRVSVNKIRIAIMLDNIRNE